LMDVIIYKLIAVGLFIYSLILYNNNYGEMIVFTREVSPRALGTTIRVWLFAIYLFSHFVLALVTAVSYLGFSIISVVTILPYSFYKHYKEKNGQPWYVVIDQFLQVHTPNPFFEYSDSM